MRQIAILLLLIFQAQTISAQEESKKPTAVGLLFDAGATTYESKELNQTLESSNFYSIPNSCSEIGIGASIQLQSVSSIVNITYIKGTSGNYEKDKSELRYNGISVEYMYDIINSDKWVLAPTGKFKITDNYLVAVTDSASSVISDNNLEETLMNYNFAQLAFGVAIERQIKIKMVDLYLGLKGAYNIDLSTGDLHNSKLTPLTNLPSLNLNGFGIYLSGRINFNLF